MNTLRARLLGSYALVIGICLAIIALALFVILRNSPLPARQEFLRLNAIARANLPAIVAPLSGGEEEFAGRLHTIAEGNDIRILVAEPDGTVFFDSAGHLESGDSLQLQLNRGAAFGGNSPRGEPLGEGSFSDANGQEWLFVATIPRGRGEQALIIFAAPRSNLPVLTIFGVNMLRPLLQAGLIAFFASIVLAVLISGSVARPLQRIALAAAAIARGDYNHKAPVRGPDEVRNLARTFNDMAAQVKLSQEAQRDFLANVTHELKTPLTSIQGFAQAILDGAERDPAHAAGIIQEEAERMHRLVEDLLDLARIESGQVVMARQHVDVAAIINAVVVRMALQAAHKKVRLEAEVGALPGTTGDGDRLAQVFTNLIDNALNHTPQGGRVSVHAEVVAGGIEVAVTDSGKGIPAADLGRIFERFYQVDKSRARGASSGAERKLGAGLGLTITKEIVEAHSGSLRVESMEGEGSTFRMWLPLPRSNDETVARRR